MRRRFERARRSLSSTTALHAPVHDVPVEANNYQEQRRRGRAGRVCAGGVYALAPALALVFFSDFRPRRGSGGAGSPRNSAGERGSSSASRCKEDSAVVPAFIGEEREQCPVRDLWSKRGYKHWANLARDALSSASLSTLMYR